MSESDRVQRWREAKRQQGLKACTVWLTPEEELRLKDLAAQRRCSPSVILQQALAQYQLGSLPSISHGTETELLREMIRAEIAAVQTTSDHATATVTDTELLRALVQEELAHVAPVTTKVTDIVTATLAQELPALVRAIVEDFALEALGMPVTDTSDRYETDTELSEEPLEALQNTVSDTHSNVPETETPPRRKGGRPTTVRPRILDLLRAHPEGLTAVEIKVHLGLDKNIGDTLAGMVRNHLLEKQGIGAQVKYFAPGAPPAPPIARPPVSTRRKRQTQPA